MSHTLTTLAPLWLMLAGAAVLVYVLKYLGYLGRDIRLPPGPRPLPVLGNALDVPTTNMEVKFSELNAAYGDVVYLDAFGQPMVILGTHEAAVELLEKRSSIYSDRGSSMMAPIAGWEWMFSLFNYGPWWRRHRKAFHQHFNTSAIVPYRAVQTREAHRFALRLLEDPKNFLQHIRLVFASTIMRITYGIEVNSVDDQYVEIAEAALAVFSVAFIPGKYLVETFPILRLLPAWFPGAGFKREGKVWAPAVHHLRDTPWENAMVRIRDGSALPSIAASLMRDISKLDSEGSNATAEVEVARNVTAGAYAGGADTTLSTLQSFFLAMASFPEVQKKAQAELDLVVGPHRLPEFSDKDALPYICALVKECLRWRSVTPIGFPHRSTQDGEFRGYLIPKGSVVVANLWAYSRDPRHYPDPETFMPERFLRDGQLDPDVLDPVHIAFGYGRRICPGRHFAEASLFILALTVLHTLEISAPLDADGSPVTLEGKMTSGVLSYPEPFELDIRPRGLWAEALVRESCCTADLVGST